MGGVMGLANWQVLFLLEGTPSIVMGVLTLAILTDKPNQAAWLTETEKELVLADLESDQRRNAPRRRGFGEALKLPQVWVLTAIQFCLTSAIPTLAVWGPTIIEDLGVKSKMMIGLLSAVPYIAAVTGIVLVGRHSDRTLERRRHSALSCLAGAVGLVLIGVFANSPALAFAALILGTTGVLSASAPFWQMPTMLLAGTAAAGGIALINSIGSFSGLVANSVVGWLRDITGKTSAGLYVVAALEVFAAALILLFIPGGSVLDKQDDPESKNRSQR
jgi:sugar phosphate permease